MNECAKFVGADVHGIVGGCALGLADELAFSEKEGIDKRGEGHGDWSEVEFWKVATEAPALVDGSGLADTGMGDEEDVEIWMEGPAARDYPHLLFQCCGDDGDRCPSAEDLWGTEVRGCIDEGVDEIVELAAPRAVGWH